MEESADKKRAVAAKYQVPIEDGRSVTMAKGAVDTTPALTTDGERESTTKKRKVKERILLNAM